MLGVQTHGGHNPLACAPIRLRVTLAVPVVSDVSVNELIRLSHRCVKSTTAEFASCALVTITEENSRSSISLQRQSV